MLFYGSKYTKVPLEQFGLVVVDKIFNHGNQARSVSNTYPVIPLSPQDTPESFHWSVINAFSYSEHTLGHVSFSQHTSTACRRVYSDIYYCVYYPQKRMHLVLYILLRIL